MFNFKLIIEYVGTNYSGWQIQDEAPSIQGAIQQAFFDFSQENVECYSAGRTDAGVHAIAMPAHIKTNKDYDTYKMLMAINFHLAKRNHQISVLSVEKVDENFHARFSAKKRHYVYKILNRPIRPVLDQDRVWWIFKPLDHNSMHIASQLLIGKHDFSSFRASECQAKSPIKTLDFIEVVKSGDLIEVRVSAKSFLHHQVRNIVGTLALVGESKISIDDFSKIFQAKNRALAGPTAPACGLYFLKAEY